MSTPGRMKPTTTPILQTFARRCHGKSFYNAQVIAAHVAAGWKVREVYRGVTLLLPPMAQDKPTKDRR